MSLWPVADRSARRFMQALYRARFEEGAGVDAALRRAGLSRLAAARAEGEELHPFHWAAFVAARSGH
jgi:CHAT domain-containing protein